MPEEVNLRYILKPRSGRLTAAGPSAILAQGRPQQGRTVGRRALEARMLFAHLHGRFNRSVRERTKALHAHGRHRSESGHEARKLVIHYNLYRFGVDEYAVGHLINGELPGDEDQRWNVIDAPRYRIEKLLAEHVQAQNTLRQCRESSRPFVLFLRSFAAENRAQREGPAISGMIMAHSKQLQDWLAFCLMERSVPIIKLFGGSDALFSGASFPGAPDTGVLSTHADNWLEIVAELISAASAIVFLVSHLSKGAALELGQIRSRNCQDRCLIVLMDPQKMFSREDGDDIETLQRAFHDFPNVFELEPPRESPRPSATSAAFQSCLEDRLLDAGAPGELDQSIAAAFSYLDPDYFVSADYVDTERFLWKELRRLKAVFSDPYWEALKTRDISYRELRFDTEWLPAHRAYGLAIATADFAAIQAALVPLQLLYTVRGSARVRIRRDSGAKRRPRRRQLPVPGCGEHCARLRRPRRDGQQVDSVPN